MSSISKDDSFKRKTIRINETTESPNIYFDPSDIIHPLFYESLHNAIINNFFQKNENQPRHTLFHTTVHKAREKKTNEKTKINVHC